MIIHRHKVLQEGVNDTIKRKFRDVSHIDFLRKGIVTHHLCEDPEIVIFIDASDLDGDIVKNGEFIHKAIHFCKRNSCMVSIQNIKKVRFYYYNSYSNNYSRNLSWNDVLGFNSSYSFDDKDIE